MHAIYFVLEHLHVFIITVVFVVMFEDRGQRTDSVGGERYAAFIA